MPFRKPTNILPRFFGGKLKYTDTNEFLSPGVLLAYKKRPNYPTPEMKLKVNAAAIQARNMVRIANDELAKVVLQRKKEPAYMTQALERHFNMAEGDLGGGLLKNNVVDKPYSPKDLFVHDRRWAINQIRENMLSLSFHLNTGMILYDQDRGQRDIQAGDKVDPASIKQTTAAYIYQYAEFDRLQLCGFKNGEIHIEYSDFATMYSLNSGASAIIHEAAHKYLNCDDKYYAFHPSYPPTMAECLWDNADSYAWMAATLATKVLRMPAGDNTDDEQCPGGKL